MLAVLDARGIPVASVAVTRILACSELATLDRWIRAAVTASSVDELFRES